MKLAVAIADTHAPPDAFVVFRGLERSIGRAAELGYQGVELALKEVGEVKREALARWLAKTGLAVSGISTGQVFAVSGLTFTDPDPAVRHRIVAVFSGLIDLARDFGRTINVGRARGFVGRDQSREQAEALFVDTARRICDIAAPAGVTLVIEPVNRYEINFVNSLDEGAALLAKVGRANLGLMPDVFHMNIEEVRIGGSLARHGERVRYVHLADSNRLAPGQGHIDFDDVFDGLSRAGFDGWVSIEILPKPDPETAARQAAEYVLPRVARYVEAASRRFPSRAPRPGGRESRNDASPPAAARSNGVRR
ncbi:MAG: sugar phosphate isomerase/epimerase [Kiritimatiellae bacterium]|nr:sugar phosphate isomerase/epimerase [Kiritimatiellia bacterium]